MNVDAISAFGGTNLLNFNELSSGGGTKKQTPKAAQGPNSKVAITLRVEVKIGQTGVRWKDESQGFSTPTSRSAEDILISSYGRFEKFCRLRREFFKIHEIVPPPADADGRTHGRTDTADFVHRLIKCYRFWSPPWFPFQSRSP